ncbi:hypothetical protein BHE74_00047583 [Ensete ventricosum]|uniref:Cyclin N-terminal domain-containing protein n=1 Tax=Ensete ventricosum TaxID=4639 RepID=A0A426ZLY6_ENSVE|nr:hypothetical protein B296_00039443 [Ensete ventricosum]RWW46482.1 hypothetical protein BHE74_00047583 [Ensete ventricosum]RZS12384.1 hypothetical protein BHM03_00043824 [Ensete ventricosum]
MAPSFDCAASILLCAEDNSSVLGFEDDVDGEEDGRGFGWLSGVKSPDFYGGFLVDFPVVSDECFGSLVERETEHMPREDYAERLRSGALDLAIRRDAIAWIWKVGDAKYIFEAKTIQRMELLVLSTLKWRMQAVTPFSYLDFFLHKFNGGSAPSKILVSRSVELILSMARGI